MEFIRNFNKLGKHDAAIAGGKGASLGEMTQAGIPVPPGFVILSGAFEQFIEETDLNVEIDAILHSVDHKRINTVDDASEKIKALILGAQMPEDIAKEIQKFFKNLNSKYVAVRSSATAEDSASAAWAGQLDSFLNTTKEDLLEKVKLCWASLFTPRAIFYRFEKELHKQKISVAVVVQKMVESEVSGIAFSVHPVTQDRNQLIIEAGFGLGESIVSGQITPDSYVVEKEPRKIIDKNIATQTKGIYREGWKEIKETEGSKQALSDKQILELSEMILNIENHYGFPVDIEWALEGGKFYIVQSRPITTLSENKSISKKVILSKIFSRERPFFYFSMWNDSDRLGFKKFVHHEVKNNLFLREKDSKGSVWYDLSELEELNTKTAELVNGDPKLLKTLLDKLQKEWKYIGPYLEGDKRLKTIKEFEDYYNHLVEWWSAMTIVFNIPGIEAVNEDMKAKALEQRARMESYSDKMPTVYLDFWKKNYPEFLDIIDVILPQEAIRLGKGEISQEDISKIRERLSGFALFNNKIYSPSELEETLRENNLILTKETIEGNISEIKGATAYPGVVKGKVRIIRLKEQISSVQKGEIIVTEMTNPDFIPAMKKAVAVVTDEGGIMCHAAIVSRELKIPCIIGTKIATQVLKDGDLVEVDADNGVVRILNKQESNNLPFTRDKALLMFETQGISFIFEDLVVSYYDDWECLTMNYKDNLQAWAPLNTVKQLNAIGNSLTDNKFKKRTENIKKIVVNIKKELPKLSSKNELSKKEVMHFFEELAKMCKEYSYFDGAYTDGLWKNKEAQKTLEHIAKYKNEIRDMFEIPFFKPNGLLETMINILSKQFGVKTESLHWYREKEILNLFEGVKILDQQIQDRKQAYVFYKNNNQEIFLHDGTKAVETYKAFQDIEAGLQRIKGITAYGRGKIKGMVRVINRNYNNPEITKNAMQSMKPGEIFVSATTDPELIEGLKKSAAIITDIGGMLSHAAITARELDKLCIVGTQIASKVLKDGMEVEVDADNGVVKILENKNSSETIPSLHYYFFRDFALATWEFTIKDEGAPQPYLNNQSPPWPYGIAERRNDLVYFYLSRRAIEWYGEQLDKFFKLDPSFPKKILSQFNKTYDAIEDIINKEPVLSLPELKNFIRDVRKFWPWFTGLWWAVENFESDERWRKAIDGFMVGRKRAEKCVPGIDAVIRKSVKAANIVDEKYISVITIDEIFSQPPSKDVLKSRLNNYLLTKDGVFINEDIDEQKKLFQLIEPEITSNTNELQGQIAYKGKVKGKVVLVRNRQEANNFPAGSILVASTTTPDFMAAIKNSVAIVTDEGGIISHAAITSRELKIPCIIGTKIATQVLKDGMEVEVDADNGIIKILK